MTIVSTILLISALIYLGFDYACLWYENRKLRGLDHPLLPQLNVFYCGTDYNNATPAFMKLYGTLLKRIDAADIVSETEEDGYYLTRLKNGDEIMFVYDANRVPRLESPLRIVKLFVDDHTDNKESTFTLIKNLGLYNYAIMFGVCDEKGIE